MRNLYLLGIFDSFYNILNKGFLIFRLNDQVEHTGSLKAQKLRLIEEGFNVTLFNDKTYYFDSKEQKYLELTKEIYDKIQNGIIRL